jgi:hypothetical protein
VRGFSSHVKSRLLGRLLCFFVQLGEPIEINCCMKQHVAMAHISGLLGHRSDFFGPESEPYRETLIHLKAW